jgi:lysophospholipase L1-like esterase
LGIENEYTYPTLLKNNYPIKYEVINAGIIGYSSDQGLRLLKKTILELKPDIITIAYSVNDVDKYRFYNDNGMPDKEITYNNKMTLINNILNKSAIINMAADTNKKITIYNKNYFANFYQKHFIRVSPKNNITLERNHWPLPRKTYSTIL